METNHVVFRFILKVLNLSWNGNESKQKYEMIYSSDGQEFSIILSMEKVDKLL